MRTAQDILYPQNVLGGYNPKIVTYNIASLPLHHGTPRDYKELNITFTGEHVQTEYTRKTSKSNFPKRTTYEKITETFYGDDQYEIQVGHAGLGTAGWSVVGDSVVFRCYHVTTLIVNGEQLI